ncbi:hypothetical protein ACVWW2_005220 [Bradyrhizobium sp. LM4.3]
MRVLISAIVNGAAQDCRSSSSSDHVALRLLRAGETRCQRERIVQDRDEADVFGNRIEGRLRARRGAARERAAHIAHATFHARRRCAEHALGLFLHEERTELERHGIKAA